MTGMPTPNWLPSLNLSRTWTGAAAGAVEVADAGGGTAPLEAWVVVGATGSPAVRTSRRLSRKTNRPATMAITAAAAAIGANRASRPRAGCAAR